jgi:poly(A) polymerase
VALSLDAAKWRKKRGMNRLLDALGAEEGLTRYVGGAVRDDLLGLPISDIDLATRIQPEEVMRRLEEARIKAVPTGIDHGTVTAVSDGQPVEITTLRRDVSTDGRRATVAFTDDWREDAARRDFTINALSADPLTGELFDYFGGLDDLDERHVRFIGDPFQRIAEDHLRILRFFRFHARFGAGEPNEAALDACTARANDLMGLSRERIADELLKLLGMDDPSTTVRVMVDRAILRPVLPEIDDGAPHRLAGLIASERAAEIAPDPLRRLAALLPRNPALGESIGGRLRLSNRAKKRLICAAEEELGHSPRALAYRTSLDCAVDRLLLAGRAPDAAALEDWHRPRLAISGGALIKRGLTEGPAVARTLKRIENEWIDAGFPAGDDLERIIEQALRAAR